MEKLQSKHLAPYFAHKVKIEHPTLLVGKREISELNSMTTLHIETKHRMYVEISQCKLVLRPLHSLTDEELSRFSMNFRMWVKNKNFNYKLIIQSDIELCCELLIDYQDLIGKGLAIDINTLKS